ncbi:MAG: TadE family protein [Bryobacteraceae bacterium]
MTPLRKATQRGQSMIESTFVLVIFFSLLFGVIDIGQALVAHEALVERVRSAVRWGVVRPYDGTGDQVANLILYGRPDEPNQTTEGYLGLKRGNVQVSYRPVAPERPDDESLTVAIVKYEYHFLSPFFTRSFVNPRPVLVSAPMAFRAVATQ